MENLFLKLLSMAITSTWLILAVLLFRLFFRKAPRWIFCLLWALVAVRLICPFSFESTLSLIPETQPFAQQMITQNRPGTPSNDATDIPSYETDTDSLPAASGHTVRPFQICGWIWAMGAAAMIGYSIVSYLRLRARVASATKYTDNVRQSEWVTSPFVLGIFHPVIYLPYSMGEEVLPYVLAHEQAHIRRKDHWWKPFGFLLLSVYWFHPGAWLGYILLCRDIESACDEKVIRSMSETQRRAYSSALLHCSIRRRSITACPLAFGENGVKQRIRSVMNYRKPAFWIVMLTLTATVMIAICFLTDPKSPNEEEFFSDDCLSVKIQNCSGTLLTYENESEQNFDIRVAGNLLLKGNVSCEFSIKEVRRNEITITFSSPLLVDDKQTWEMKLHSGEQVRCMTPTVGGATIYTFSIEPREQRDDGTLLGILDEIVNNPDVAASSNPYDYLQGKPELYAELLSCGEDTVDCFVSELRSAKNYGLREYLMAAVCSELTGVGDKNGSYETSWWSTAQEWLTLYDKSMEGDAGETRLCIGSYIPISYQYLSPLSSDLWQPLSEKYRYTVTEDSFVTEDLQSGTETRRNVAWGWKPAKVSGVEGMNSELAQVLPATLCGELAFLKETFIYDIAMQDNSVYQSLGRGEYLLQTEQRLYLLKRGPNNSKLDRVWSAILLVSEEESTLDMETALLPQPAIS